MYMCNVNLVEENKIKIKKKNEKVKTLFLTNTEDIITLEILLSLYI